MDSNILQDFPDDDEQAFLRVERAFHDELKKSERDWGQDGPPPATEYIEYMSKTLSAAKELGIEEFSQWSRPSVNDYDPSHYQDFRQDVVHYRTAIEIRLARRARASSVRLSPADKLTIHHHIGQIRELLTQTPVDERKRARLFDKLGAFESEVDRDRTKMEAFGVAFVELSGYVGEGLERAQVFKLLDKIAGVIHGAKEEETAALPPPGERKQIEPPKDFAKLKRETAPDSLPKPKTLAEDLDDEIPF
jgi:hypothetical protein